MLKYLLILFSFVCLCSPSTKAQEKVYADTLSYDTAKINGYKQNSRFDYNSQLIIQEFNLWQIIDRWLERGLSKIFGNKFARKYTEPILIGIFVLIILLVIYFIYRKRPELFFRESKKKLIANPEEETIYDVDFDSEITNSLRTNDYKLAVRLLYLQTLKHLNDKGIIDWQPFKTPTEYLYEAKKVETKKEFRILTDYFLRIRYGNFEATEQTYRTVKHLQEVIRKGGKA